MRVLAGLLALAVLAVGAPPAERKNRLHVPLWVSPTSSSVSPVLGPAALTARVNGAPTEVEAVRGPSEGLVLMLVLDLTADLSLADLAKDALAAAVATLPPNTQVAVLRAQDELTVLLDPTADHEAVTGAIRAFPVSGKAGFLDSLPTTARIADGMLDNSGVRAGVLYVTDSNVRNYREDYINPVINSSDQHDMSRRFPDALIREKISKLQNKLALIEAPLFIVHTAYRADGLNDAYQTGLLQLIPSWGGSAALCRSRAEVSESIASAFQAAVSHYSVVLRLPERKTKSLQVQFEAPGYSLSYRNRFVPE